MNTRIKIIIMLIIAAQTLNSQNNTYVKINDIKQLEAKLNENSNKNNTIQSDFVQNKTIEYLDETIVSKGKFWFKKSNNLRWEYNEPFNYIITIKDGKFTIKDGNKISNYDINTNAVFKEINDLLISMAEGNMIKDDKFFVEAFENKTSYLLKLTPKNENMKNFINKTEVYIDKIDLSVYKIIMLESESDFTEILFTNRKFNEEIRDNIFIVN